MDRRDGMAMSGSASFYMQQRGAAGSGTGGAQPGLNVVVSSGINPLATTSMAFQSSIGGSNIGSSVPTEPSISAHNFNVGAPTAVPSSSSGEPLKRKRGRPRKYGPEGTFSLALSSPSLSTHSGTLSPANKRKRGRPPGTGRKQQIVSFGGLLSGSAGIGFTPHVIHVEVGEDIAMKLMSFSQQGPRAICVLSANGAVSTVTLCQPSTSGGTVTYEGRFEILCLSGSYLPTNDDARNRSGILSVSLASPDGRVIGGGVGGVLVAACPVQVIVGSFLWGSMKSKNKKPEGPSDSRDSEHQRTGNPVASTSILPSQNLTPTSSVGLWPSSRPVEIPESHVDIDLMRG